MARQGIRLFIFLGAVVGLVMVDAFSAEALDPARTLTQYVHRIWQVQQGLPQASVYAIAQTKDGRLWLGTQTGLVRFDGVRFASIDQLNGISLADVWVTQLVEGEDRSLWIGTDQSGVFRLLNGTLTHYSTREGLPSDAVQCLFEDRGGRLWVCTPGGLANWNGKAFQAFQVPGGHTIRNVRATCETPDRRLWMAHEDSHLDIAEVADRLGLGPQAVSVGTQNLPVGAPAAIQAMLCSGSTGVWIGTDGAGVFHLTDGLVTRVTTADGLADNRVLSLAESRDGSVLVGTTNGFSRIRGPEIESFTPKDGLSQSAVYALYEDREQTLWAATGHGLNQFLDGRATPYTTSEGLPSNDTGPVVLDRTGTMWVGTLGAGLARFDGHDFNALTVRDGLASNTVRALAADDSGGLWVGTDRGLNRILHGRVSGVWTTRNGLPSDAVSALMVDSAGRLWIATSRGAARYDHGTIERLAGTSAAISALGEDGQHHVYLAPQGGALLEYSNGTLTAVADPHAKQLGSSSSPATALMNVDAMYTDQDGLMWVGTTGGGLGVIDHGRISRFSVRDGLFDDSIYGIVGDNRERLWMACSKGIFSVERSQLLRFAAGQHAKIVSTPYSPTDVLRTIECKSGIQPAVWGTASGQLWFSTVRGLLLLDSKNVDRRFSPPPAAIDEITVNGEPTKLASDLGRLRPDLNNVAFRYTGLSFIVPTRITFRYQLEGFDKKWVDAGPRREAFYTNLSPGQYRFQVEACNLEGECLGTSEPVAFIIEPRYYQRAWFIPACVLAAVLVGLAGYRRRIQRLREQFEVVLAERNRIARELHDTLIQGFSGITMAMQALAARLPAGNSRQTLEQIVADAGSSLTEARRSLFGLRSGHAVGSGLAEAIEQSARQLTEAKDIRLKLKLDDAEAGLPAEVEYHLLRIAQEAVLNAVKHSGGRSLLVALERTATRVRLLVKDDGSGFDGSEEPRPGHFGVVGMHERAAQIGSHLQLESAPGTGTTVSVTVSRR